VLPRPTRLSRLAVDKVEINARIEHVAARVGVPADLVKAVAWQESAWTHVRRGDLVRQANRDPATGEVTSVDAGIMQINDRAHPRAYPQAATLDGNLYYGTRHLKFVLDHYGPDQVWRYNGDPAYSLRIERHLRVKPWQPVVLGDHLKALQREQADLSARLPRQEKTLESLRRQVEQAQNQAAGRPSRKLADLEGRLAGLEDEVQRGRVRLGELATEIPAVRAWLEQEKARVAQATREVDAELAGRLREQMGEFVEQLAQRQGRISRLLPRASRMQRRELEEMRRQLARDLAEWRQAQGKVDKKGPSSLAELYGELWRARRAAERHEARLQQIEAGLPPSAP
jgi:predicted  nucleic acid-binding Zn-ribbon protein